MTGRRVRFTATAQDHVEREHRWWRENRDHRELFNAELDAAVQLVSFMPGAGTLYALAPIPDVRRVYLRRIDCHLYYTFDNDEVIVRALWGARREHGPAQL